MAVDAASGALTEPEERLRDMLAECATVQTFFSVGTAADAKTKMFYDGLDAPTTDEVWSEAAHVALFPYILIWTDEETGFSLNLVSHSAAYDYLGSGQLMVRVERLTDKTKTIQEEERTFKNEIGNMFDDLIAETGPGEALWIRTINVESLYVLEPERRTLGEQDATDGELFKEIHGCLFSVEWGES